MGECAPTELAARLGITREEFPWLFYATDIEIWDLDLNGWRQCRAGECVLPHPTSQSPRAVVWEPWLLRAANWPAIRQNNPGSFYVDDGSGDWPMPTYESYTAALFAAWLDSEGARS